MAKRRSPPPWRPTRPAAGTGAAGATVRRGSCDNVTTAEALGPILDAFPELIAAVDDEAGLSRLRLFRKVREALSESPMLLLLEDVHWADEATLDILRYLGRRLAGVRLMILATYRSEEVGRDHPLTVVMGDLAGLAGVVRTQLPALSVTGVRQLLEAAGSTLDADATFQRTGGTRFTSPRCSRPGPNRCRPRCAMPYWPACPGSRSRPGGRRGGVGARPPRRDGFPRRRVGPAARGGR